jgi:hypothetical protein
MTKTLAAILVSLACVTSLEAGNLSLSPAVVPLAGRFGQSTTQGLTIRNDTALDLSFDLMAKDVAVREGQRVFVDAGELPDGIAATAVFSARTVTVPAGRSQTVEVTLTLPPATRQRAVVALFRGTTPIRNGAGTATASLGTLLTFTLTPDVSLAASELVARTQSPTRNATFEQTFANDGHEPAIVKGVTVVLDGEGALVGRVPFETRRLLPGEAVTLGSEYSGELPAGAYRALSTVDVDGRAVTRAASFEVP